SFGYFHQALELFYVDRLLAISLFMVGKETLQRLVVVPSITLLGLLLGPVAGVVPPALTVWYGLSPLFEDKVNRTRPGREEAMRTLLFLCLPLLVYGACLYVSEKVVFGVMPGNPHLHVHHLPAMAHFTLYDV